MNTNIDRVVNDAMAAVRAGKHNEAVKLCRFALEQRAEHAGAMQVMAIAEHHRRNDNEAVDWLRKAIKLRPNDASLRYNLGVMLQELGRADEAAQAYRRSLELNRDSIGAWNNLGVVLRQAGRHGESLEVLNKALEQNPDSATTLTNLATTLRDMGQLPEAELKCREALRISPQKTATHNVLGLILKEAGHPDKAMDAYREALAVEPDNIEANVYLANLLSNDGQHSQAIEHYQRALKRRPENVHALTNLAVAYNRAGKRDKAIETAQKACDLKRDDAELHYNLAAMLSKDRDTKQLERAKRELDDALHLDPKHAPSYQVLAIVLSKLGDLKLAVSMARRGTEIDPEDVSLWVTLGDMQAHSDDLAAAIESLGKAVSLAPDRSQPNRQLGIACLRAGRYQEARDALATAHSLDDNDQRTIAHLGLALAALGEESAQETLLGMNRFVSYEELQPVAPFESMAALNDALEKDIRKHPTLRFEPAGLAARKSHLTGELMESKTPAITAFDQMLRKAIDHYIQQLDGEDQHPFIQHRPKRYRINLWATLSEGEGYVDSHIHEESWLSGAYYVRVPNTVGDDESEPAGWFEFGTPADHALKAIDGPVRRIRPLEGQLALFPSYLFHRTLPHNNEQGRISIAFDLEPLD